MSNISSPTSAKGTSTYRENCKKRKSLELERNSNEPGCSKTKTAKRRLSNLDVSEFIAKNNIHSQHELFSKAEERRAEGENDLASFIMNRSEKFLLELVSKTWMMKTSKEELNAKVKTRMEFVEEAAKSECIDGCNGKWLDCAIEVLQLNGINPLHFSFSLKTLMEKGRGKHRNVLLVGPSNSAKTFMFKPIKSLFPQVFENPSNDKYAWVGAEQARVILLQDFRHSKELIAWHDLLLLLEGETVKLPAPKNHFKCDILIDSDVPILATSKCEIKYRGSYGSIDEREDEMMSNRWKLYRFHHVFQEHQQKEVLACTTCFAKLVLMEDL